MREPDFEWDAQKDRINQEKHDVSFETAQDAFFDPDRLIAEDTDHSATESRYYCFGLVNKDVLTVRFTYRGDEIRILGAGYWRKGRKQYEKEKN